MCIRDRYQREGKEDKKEVKRQKKMNVLKNLTKLLKSTKIDPKPAVPAVQIIKDGESKYKKKEKYYITKGPMLYISKLLYQKGNLNSNQIWDEYLKYQPHDQEKLFRSKRFLKRFILRQMIIRGKIVRQGYVRPEKKFLGYRVIPKEAFKAIHPDILMNFNPLPNIRSTRSKAVSYTHLTLPTICSVQISVVAVSLKKKKNISTNRDNNYSTNKTEKRTLQKHSI
eukprot:TRINITY_DN14002_c0_g1_i2.p2 TRINITY_DN14002_c0_g1~~TRINITY_DN14002_c0_g1_i2.p2  ORF type:complete len:225 (-),score=52.73 TRINITY_DN14002_c0_g1_i2:7-681(-)